VTGGKTTSIVLNLLRRNTRMKILMSIIMAGLATMIIGFMNTKYSEVRLPRSSYGPTMDVAVADFDKDRDLDIFLAMEFQPNVLLINDGKGNFRDESDDRLPDQMNDSEDIAVADFDKDGDLDIIVASEDDLKLNLNPVVHQYYENTGKGKFIFSKHKLPNSEANAIAAADLNGDKYEDLVLGNAGQDFILINDKGGGFLDETKTRFPNLTETTQDVKLVDVDGDNDLDVFLGSEDENKLLLNDGKGFFTDVTSTQLPARLNPETRKVEFGDVDKDGDLDAFLSNVAWKPNKDAQDRLYINNGKGFFIDETAQRLPVLKELTLDGIFTDLDGDKDLDLLTINFSQKKSTAKTYVNNGTGKFELVENYFAPNLAGAGIAVLAADLNKDGKNDYYYGFRGQKDRLFLSGK
jgi:hypothetical protein